MSKPLVYERPPNYGITMGIVTNNDDPVKMGRVKLQIPSVLGLNEESSWALPAFPFGGRKILPQKDQHVWVFFQGGNIDTPVYFATWWTENTIADKDNVNSHFLYDHKGNVIKIVEDVMTVEPKNSLIINAPTEINTQGSIKLGGDTPVARLGDEITVVVDGTTYKGTITKASSKVTCS